MLEFRFIFGIKIGENEKKLFVKQSTDFFRQKFSFGRRKIYFSSNFLKHSHFICVVSEKIVSIITQESEIVIAGETSINRLKLLWSKKNRFAFSVEMPDLQSGVYPIGTESISQDESESIFENKSGLAEDLKFLASMPELCDITFLVGETREPVCAVKVSVLDTHFQNCLQHEYFCRLSWQHGHEYSLLYCIKTKHQTSG